MREKSYRLGQYEIIEKGSGEIWWKSHGGFGNVKGGKCFIEGDVLFIGHSETDEIGFLKTEFLEYLGQLPEWDRTKYYCSTYALYNCRGGRARGDAQHSGKKGASSYDRASVLINNSIEPAKRIDLTSLSPAAGIRHMRGKLEKALRHCRGLVGHESEGDDSEK